MLGYHKLYIYNMYYCFFMAKVMTCITLDKDILEALRAKHLNLSGLLNTYLRSYLKLDEVKPIGTRK